MIKSVSISGDLISFLQKMCNKMFCIFTVAVAVLILFLLRFVNIERKIECTAGAKINKFTHLLVHSDYKLNVWWHTRKILNKKFFLHCLTFCCLNWKWRHLFLLSFFWIHLPTRWPFQCGKFLPAVNVVFRSCHDVLQMPLHKRYECY